MVEKLRFEIGEFILSRVMEGNEPSIEASLRYSIMFTFDCRASLIEKLR